MSEGSLALPDLNVQLDIPVGAAPDGPDRGEGGIENQIGRLGRTRAGRSGPHNARLGTALNRIGGDELSGVASIHSAADEAERHHAKGAVT